ncbi:hypothetical protein D3C87_256770 [compost metagenome]
MNDLQKWIRIRKELYRQMETQVRHRLGEDTPELERYQKTYEAEFNKKWQASTKDALIEQIAVSRVVLMGDFHAMKQSQKAQLRILRTLPPQRPKVLAVEFFESADQAKVDRFMSGKMSEKDFLKAIQWQGKWGFPWEHYRPLIRWAQKSKVPVYGINKSTKKRNASTLKSRDVFAGKLIAELANKQPDSLVFVIYGDLHLAQSHIPAEITKNLGAPFAKSILRIFQNAEKIYFQLLGKELESSTDLVRISKNSFCLMSVPPWVKWQNYLMYLEQAYDLDLDDDDDDDELDYTDHVSRYVKIISEELNLPVAMAGLSVYTAKDTQLWGHLKEKYDARQLKWIESLISDEMSFYLPEVGVAYLARGTVNHAASLAMQFVHAQICQNPRSFSEMPADFLPRIWIEAVSYFGSKIINYKRKADTITDLKASLASKSPVDHGKEAMMLALSQKMHEMMVITGSPKHRRLTQPRMKWSYMTAAALLGGMMGERIYFGYRKKLLSLKTLQDFLKKPVANANFQVAYYDMVEVVESLPTPFNSKKEKL